VTDYITILAEAVETTTKSGAAEDAVVPVDLIWEHITSLGVIEALTFISFGTVCLFYGWRVFKILVIISFALIGLALGVLASEKINGEDHQLIGGLIGLILMAVLSVPLMRWAVCVLGAAAGGTLTGGLWYAAKLPEEYIWAGGLIGIVAGGMISFIIFKIAVMLFSSLGGSTLVVTGVFAILYLYPGTTDQIEELFFGEKWFLPTALLVPSIVGIFVQNKFIKGSKDWDI
jgi:hypothetical protein